MTLVCCFDCVLFAMDALVVLFWVLDCCLCLS